MSKPSNIARAGVAWGRSMPDWVAALARECDATSQRLTAERVGYSAATINQVLGANYKGDLARVERAIRIELLPQTVACPVLGPIDEKQCLHHQSRPLRANHVLVQLANTCPRCPNNANRKDQS
jgi:hypothetical protein